MRCGGGVNHRMSLSDAALVKDNHVVAAGGVAAAFDAVRREFPGIAVEVEVDSLDQLDEVLAAGADLVLLDNFTVEQMREAVRRDGRPGPARGLGRAVAAGGRRGRRHRRGLPCGRSPHPLGAGARHRCRPASGVVVLLAIDVGNTNTVLGMFEGEDLASSWRIKTDARTTADEMALTYRGLLADAGDDQRHRAVQHGARRPARDAGDARPLLRRRSDRHRRARHQDRRARAHRQPEGGGRRPHREHDRRPSPVRRPVHRRRLRHVDEPRRRLGQGRVPRRCAGPGDRDLPGCPRLAGRAAAQGGAGAAAVGRSARTRSRPCSPAPSTDSPARSTASSTASSRSSATSRRWWPPAASRPSSCRSRQTITHHEPDLTLVGLRLVFEKNAEVG